jgi:hypothetical protein
MLLDLAIDLSLVADQIGNIFIACGGLLVAYGWHEYERRRG